MLLMVSNIKLSFVFNLVVGRFKATNLTLLSLKYWIYLSVNLLLRSNLSNSCTTNVSPDLIVSFNLMYSGLLKFFPVDLAQ